MKQQNEWTEKAKRIDFDRLEALVIERIDILKSYVSGSEGISPIAHEAICRDLVFPIIGPLANFIESVSVGVDDGDDDQS